MVNQVAHANSLTDTYANDPNLMARPASITVTTPAEVVRWATGAYGYDGADNIKTMARLHALLKEFSTLEESYNDLRSEFSEVHGL